MDERFIRYMMRAEGWTHVKILLRMVKGRGITRSMKSAISDIKRRKT